MSVWLYWRGVWVSVRLLWPGRCRWLQWKQLHWICEEEEEAGGTAMEQAEASAEVSATDDACAGAGVEEGCWWWCVYVCEELR